MPIYSFKCSECDFGFNDILRMNDRDEYVGKGCGNCGAKDSIIRIPTSGSFRINGYSEANGYSKQSSNRK